MKIIKIFLLIFLITSCKSPQVVTERYFKDSTIVREVPKIIEVPGATVQSPSINIDSLLAMLKAGIKPDIINRNLYYEDPETKLRVGILIDELGNLSALCEQQDRTIEILMEELTHWQKEYEKATVYVEPTFWERAQNFVNTLGFLIVVAVVAILFLVRR